jgi:uncharacterized membrane protein YphA (DoxX/SURF4 family)
MEAALITDPTVVLASAIALAAILLLGALEKLRDLTRYSAAVAAYGLLPPVLVNVFARLFALLELAAGVMLLLPGELRVAGAWLALVLLVLVTTALALNLLRGHTDIDCGCGGPAHAQVGLSWWLIGRNALLLACCVPALLPAGTERVLQWIDAPALLGATLAIIGLYFTINHLIASHTQFVRPPASMAVD